VKYVGWLNWKAQLEQAHWPFTRQAPNVAIDEWRTPYAEYRFTPSPGRGADHLREVWFAGVHSDVGGVYPDDHKMSDIALKWMVDEAVAADLRVDPKAYRKLLDADLGAALSADHARGLVHTHNTAWRALGRHRRPICPSDEVHPSVRDRVKALRGTRRPYNVQLPAVPGDAEGPG
jgi:hypothetical protein